MTAVEGNVWKMIEIFIEILIKKTEHFPNTKLIQVQVSCWLPFCFELNQKKLHFTKTMWTNGLSGWLFVTCERELDPDSLKACYHQVVIAMFTLA